MIRNYLKSALRNLLKDGFYSFINITGLAIAMTCFIFIFLFVNDELSYDKYHQDADRIYRITTDIVSENGDRSTTATTPPALGPLVQKEVPEIELATRIFPTNTRKTLFRYGDKIFFEDRMYNGDSNVFRMFSFPIVKGNPETALRDPNSVVLTESTSKKYFGDHDGIGEILTVEDQYLGVMDLVVTAIIKDIPLNSHFRFDMMRPSRYMISQNIDESWGFAAFHTYVKLKENSSGRNIADIIQQVVKQYNPESRNRYSLQPLSEIHLHSNLQNEIEPNGSFKSIVVLITLAIFIIIVAGINYVNLSIARSVNRAKEVGVRKVSGALKSSLITQFMGESMLISFAALSASILFVLTLLPSFNQLTGKNFEFFQGSSLFTLTMIFAFALLIGLVSGVYPALYLSSFSPVKVLRNNLNEYKNTWGLRSILVSVQFITSITLIVCTSIIIKQMDFIQHEQLGFEKEQIIVIPDVYKTVDKKALRDLFLQNPRVVNVAASSGMIYENNWGGKMISASTKNEISIEMCNIDTAYLQTMGMTILEKGEISLSDSTGGIVINETAAKQLGLLSPVGEKIFWPGDRRPQKIVGVVKDFHFESLHEKIGPFAFQYLDQFLSNLFIRIKTSDLQGTLKTIESDWKQIAPDRPFQYFFLDSQIDNLYRADIKFKTFFSIATMVAMFIACLGLLGLTSLTVKNKTKEIGIRKVLGATAANIISLLSKKMLAVILISNIIALPVAYVAMQNWLANFAYHIELSTNFWIFLLTSILVISTTLLIITLLALKAMQTNPVKALRSE